MSKHDGLDALFTDKDPVVRDIYDRLAVALSKLGAFDAEAKKTSIHLVHGTAFAGAHPRKAWLDITIRTATPLSGPRVRAQQQVSKSRWHQDIRLVTPRDIDRELIAWLKVAYNLTV